MSRAVSEDAALIAGPNHGSRVAGSRPENVSMSWARAVSNQAAIQANQEHIQANQDKLLEGQREIVANQREILGNQKKILKD